MELKLVTFSRPQSRSSMEDSGKPSSTNISGIRRRKFPWSSILPSFVVPPVANDFFSLFERLRKSISLLSPSITVTSRPHFRFSMKTRIEVVSSRAISLHAHNSIGSPHVLHVLVAMPIFTFLPQIF